MLSELQPYPRYRDSNLSGFSTLPDHWETRRAKYCLREVDERSSTGRETLLSVSHLTGVTPRSEKTVSMFLAKSNVGHKVCRPGDVVINTLWAWMAALGVAKHHGVVSPAYGVYRPLTAGGLEPRFTHYLLRTQEYAAEYRRRSTGINSSRMRLYPEQFLCIPLVCPRPDEQTAIVKFLDHACNRVDKELRAKRRVIALLSEQRRAVVLRAVTRGINDSVSMRASGVPWLGDIPEHWHLSRIKNEFYCLNTRRVPLNAAQRGEMVTRTYDYYGASGVIDRVNNYLFDDDLVLLAEDGANLVLRNLPLAIVARGKFWVNNHAHILKPKRGNIEYLAALLEGLNYEPWISGAAQPKLTKDRLLAISIAVAPPEEQGEIVRRYAEVTAPLVRAIKKLESEVRLLLEYRTRLVSDVVSGRVDVRAAARKLPDVELANESVEPELADGDEADDEVASA